MSSEQQYRSASPAFNGMESEVYIDGKSVTQGGYIVKERQRGKNPCMQILRFIRSNFVL
jgi:hypothetical protein